MLHNRYIRIIAGMAAATLLFIFFLYLFFPMGRLNAALDGLLAQQGLKLSPQANKKIIPGLAWKKPVLSSEQGDLFKADEVNLKPAWGELFSGSVALSTNIGINGGTVDFLTGVIGKTAMKLSVRKLSLSDVPFFATSLGAKAGGELWSEGVVNRSKQGLNGEVKLEIKGLELSGVKLGAFPLPDVSGLTAQGAVRVAAGKARLESLTLQGEGIYMRLSGDIPSGSNAASSPLDMTLEIMPKPEFLEKQKLVFMLLIRFMTSPGVYRIPVHGTLLKPAII